MSTILMFANGTIEIDGRVVAYVAQTAEGTRVYRLNDGRTIDLPANIYALSTDHPVSGIPGRAEFESDLVAALQALAGEAQPHPLD